MNQRSKLLLAAASMLLLPLTASARPPECDNQCSPTRSCTLLCTMGSSVITCGEFGVCSGALPVQPSEPQASAQQPAPAQADDTEAVCRAPDDQAQG
ncbi:hypothetical protein HRD49_21730 [Corallococcus exiguus]|uniref:hypothetical protein n=1 Tax=Corallococcus TaxID=83461 RepID=UPI000F89480D|nr:MULTISPECIES: hypothetical protein [Corallococcus]NNC21845.1 hypothetical protein [Corallococcus exiguus]NRD56521.1 hypothetical protein [Corallococcus exiguus]NRD64376.1 hypothetical protein [Corallococcus exiguus]RUO87100.1 hypothetical protein D7Y11_42470 [Corallococcus sp. AB018]